MELKFVCLNLTYMLLYMTIIYLPTLLSTVAIELNSKSAPELDPTSSWLSFTIDVGCCDLK